MWKKFALLICALYVATVSVKASDPPVLHIGIMNSMVKNLSPTLQLFLGVEFNGLVKEFTGLPSKVYPDTDLERADRNLHSGDLHLVIYQGVEFAWARVKDPQLQPLMVATFKQPTLHAVLVTRKDEPVSGFGDLKGKDIFMLGREHCRLFAEKEVGGKVSEYFGSVRQTCNIEAALDEVLLGKVQAAVVDNVSFEIYQTLHPGRFERLQTVAQSEAFPAPVIAYRQGALSERMLAGFRDGMQKCNQTDRGREALAAFQFASLAPVPADFQQTLDAILKAYPPPE